MADLPAREAMEFDVVIVGAGPAGLSAAIRLKQINPDISVVIVEKGSEVGAHILSGGVIDPVGLDRLLPEWRGEDSPVKTAVSDDRFYWLSAGAALRLPNFAMPPPMNNHGNFIVSLGRGCRWAGGTGRGGGAARPARTRRREAEARPPHPPRGAGAAGTKHGGPPPPRAPAAGGRH